VKNALLAFIVALVFAPISQGGAAARQAPGLPLHGVLTPGISLAGIHIGDTTAKVKSVWGRNYKLCPDCKGTYWYYIYTHGEPLGAAVKFSKAGRVVAAFTLTMEVDRYWSIATVSGHYSAWPGTVARDLLWTILWTGCAATWLAATHLITRVKSVLIEVLRVGLVLALVLAAKFVLFDVIVPSFDHSAAAAGPSSSASAPVSATGGVSGTAIGLGSPRKVNLPSAPSPSTSTTMI